MSRTMPGSKAWQKVNRNMALSYHHLFAQIHWDGREIPLYLLLCKLVAVIAARVLTTSPDSKRLHHHFTGCSPAFFADLAHGLKSKEYVEEPEETVKWRHVPTFLGVLKEVINGCVELVSSP